MLLTVDFLEFAVKNCTLEKILKFLNFETVKFCDGGRFNVNYKSSKILRGFCKIGYDNDNTIYDIYVSLSGSGCRLLEDYNSEFNFDWYDFLRVLTTEFDISFRRIDIAIDDYTDTLNTEKLVKYWEQGKFAGACRSVPDHRRLRSEELYFGSTQSDYMIRIYNKGLERGFKPGEKILNSNTGELVDYWWRLEQQIRGHKSEQFVLNWMQSGSDALGDIACGYIHEFIRFLTRYNDKKNSQRIPECKWWVDFLSNAKRFKFTSKPGTVYNKHKLESFLNNQVATSIKTYIHLLGLSPEDLYRHFDNDDILLNNSQLALLRANAIRIKKNLERLQAVTAEEAELPFDPVLDGQLEFIESLLENDNQYYQMNMGDEFE